MALPAAQFVTPAEREGILLQAEKLPFHFKHKGLKVSHTPTGFLIGQIKCWKESDEFALRAGSFSQAEALQLQSEREIYWRHLKSKAVKQLGEDGNETALSVDEIARYEQNGIPPDLVQDIQLGILDCQDKTCRGRCKIERQFRAHQIPKTIPSTNVGCDTSAMSELLKDSTPILLPSSESSLRMGIIDQTFARSEQATAMAKQARFQKELAHVIEQAARRHKSKTGTRMSLFWALLDCKAETTTALSVRGVVEDEAAFCNWKVNRAHLRTTCRFI
jgi:hypothetical protein